VSHTSSSGLTVILLPTLECNLACDYCFEEHPRGRWSVEQTEEVLEQVFELADRRGVKHLTIHWQGGEALLMPVEYWKRVCGRAREMASSRCVGFDQSMQTNLLGYDREVGALAHEYFASQLGTSFELGSSRRYLHGDGQRFQQRWRNAFTRARADQIKVGVIDVLGEDAMARGAERYLDIMSSEIGIQRLRFNLPFKQSERQGSGFWLDPVAAGRFLVDAYHWWVRHGRDEQIHLKPFGLLEDILRLGNSARRGLCIFSKNCSDFSIAVAPDGSVALCDSFFGSEEFDSFGNLFETPLLEIHAGSARAQMRIECAKQLRLDCMDCRYISLCHGGCVVRSHRRPEGPYFHYCETYEILFSAIEGALAQTG